MSSNDPLQLKYIFTSDQQFIRASADGTHINTISLSVTISDPSTHGVTLKQITLNIPTGEESSRSISDDPDLPPVQRGSDDWQVTCMGGTITIKPMNGAPATIAVQPLEFTLSGLRVNQTPGTVPITITELSSSGPKRTDSSTYKLEKHDADFPVASFHAEPDELNDLDQAVTLYWECTEQGHQYAYNVHSDSWRPKNCLDGGDCYTWQDGNQGIQTTKLTDSTTFALDVIQTDSLGHRKIYKTLSLKVNVTMPWVSQNSYASPLLFGCLVVLHWLANNAKTCTLKLNGKVIDSPVPTDTYQQGYPVALVGEKTRHQFDLVAQSGPAQAHFSFPPIPTDRTCHISHNLAINTMAVAPNGKFALAVAQDSAQGGPGIWTFDFEQGRVNTVDSVLPGWYYGLAITPDGAQAYGVNPAYRNVTIFDTAKWQAPLAEIELPLRPNCIALTKDGSLAFVGSYEGQLMAVDIANRKVQTYQDIQFPFQIKQIAVSPDGQSLLLGLASLDAGGESTFSSVVKLDISSRKADKIADWGSGRHGESIAIAPDGNTALVVLHCTVTALDLTAKLGEATTFKNPPGLKIFSLITMPDGRVVIYGRADHVNDPPRFIEVYQLDR